MADRRFACTMCGACCNRAPEVELGEAAALADVFVWQMLFRLYSMPRRVGDYAPGSAAFFETKRLLSAFAAHAYTAKVRSDGAVQERTFYLTISAIAFDPVAAGCPALADKVCSIYERRPLSCRSVPLHYSRPLATAQTDLDHFTANPGFECATGPDAPLFLVGGTLADPATATARAESLDRAAADAPWKAAIVKAMKRSDPRVPTLAQVEQNAARGALTVPMRGSWEIAAEAGLISDEGAKALLVQQGTALDRLSALPALTLEAARQIAEQRRELG